jgi:hypothetical protein
VVVEHAGGGAQLADAATSHHMRVVRERGWLVVIDSRQVRGVLQTFYRLGQDLRREGEM